MKRQSLKELMVKVGLDVPSKARVSEMKDMLVEFLEENGLDEDLELTTEESEYIVDTLGFELDEEGNLDEEEDFDDEEDEEEDDEEDEEEDDEEDEEPAPKPKPKKASPRANRKQAILQAIENVVSKSKKGLTRQQIIDKVMEKVEGVNAGTIGTYISDGKNPKYCQFDSLLVQDEEKRLTFEN